MSTHTHSQIPYSSPVAVSDYPTYGSVLTLLGLVITAVYSVMQMQTGKRNIIVDVVIAIIASVALGFGGFFLMLSFGQYV